MLARNGWWDGLRLGIAGTFSAPDGRLLRRRARPEGLRQLVPWHARSAGPAERSIDKEIRRPPPNYGEDGLAIGVTDRVGITERIVLAIIVFGTIVTLIWLKRALSSYAQDPALSAPAARVERDLSHRSTPPKLGWNWGAFFLGPVWYLTHGLWVYAVILTILIMLSGGILLPFVMLYGAFKANETLEDAHLARYSLF